MSETLMPTVLAFVGLAYEAPDADFLGHRYRVMPVPLIPGTQQLYVTIAIADEVLSDPNVMEHLSSAIADQVAKKVREILTGSEAAS